MVRDGGGGVDGGRGVAAQRGLDAGRKEGKSDKLSDPIIQIVGWLGIKGPDHLCHSVYNLPSPLKHVYQGLDLLKVLI